MVPKTTKCKMVYDREPRDLMKDRAKKLRKAQTGAEYHLWKRLKKSGEVKVLRQCVVGKLILDFGLPFRNLLIEVDDPSHETRQERDARRDAWLRNLGFNILRVLNEAIFSNCEGVIEQIVLFPSSEENKNKFQMSIRAARAKSYWKLVPEPDEKLSD